MALSTEFLYVGDSEGLKKFTKSGSLVDSATQKGACTKVTIDASGDVYAQFDDDSGYTFRKFDDSLNEQWSVSSYFDTDDETGQGTTRDVQEAEALIHVPSTGTIYYGTSTFFGEARIGRIDAETGEHYGALEIDNSVTGLTWDARGYLWASTRTNSDSVYNVYRILYDGLVDSKWFIDTDAGADNNDPIKSIRFDNDTQSIVLTPFDGSIRKYNAPTDYPASLTKEWETGGYFNESYRCESAIDEQRAFYHGTGDSTAGRGIAKIDQSGSEVWHAETGDEISEVIVDRDHSVYAISDNTIQGEELVYKFDQFGNKQFDFYVGNEVYDLTVFHDFETDPYAWRDGEEDPNYINPTMGGDLVQLSRAGGERFTRSDDNYRTSTVDADGVIFTGTTSSSVYSYDNDEHLLWDNDHDVNHVPNGIDHHQNGYIWVADTNNQNSARILKMSERDGFVLREYTDSTFSEAVDVASARWDDEFYYIANRGTEQDGQTGELHKISGDSIVWTVAMCNELQHVEASYKGPGGIVGGGDSGQVISDMAHVFAGGIDTTHSERLWVEVRDDGDVIDGMSSSNSGDTYDVAVGAWEEDGATPVNDDIEEFEDLDDIGYNKFNERLEIEGYTIRLIDQYDSTRWEYTHPNFGSRNTSDATMYPSSGGHEFIYTSTPTESDPSSVTASITQSETAIPTVSTSNLFDTTATATTSETLLEETSVSQSVAPSTQMLVSNTLIQADTVSATLSPSVTLTPLDEVADADTSASILSPDVFVNISDSDTQSETFTIPNTPTVGVTTTEGLKQQLSEGSLQLVTSSILTTESELGTTANSTPSGVSSLVSISNTFSESFTESSTLTRPINVKPSMTIADSYAQGTLVDVSGAEVGATVMGEADTLSAEELIAATLNVSQAFPGTIEPSALVAVGTTTLTTQERLDLRDNSVPAMVSASEVGATSLRQAPVSSKEIVVDSDPTISSAVREAVIDPTVAITNSRKTKVLAGSHRNTYAIERTKQTFGDFNTFNNV